MTYSLHLNMMIRQMVSRGLVYPLRVSRLTYTAPDMVVVTFLKSDPYHLMTYEVQEQLADDAIEEYRDLKISFYRSKREDEV